MDVYHGQRWPKCSIYATGSLTDYLVYCTNNNFNDPYKNTVAPPTIDHINRDFDPHTSKTWFQSNTLVKQFDNYELKINASRGEETIKNWWCWWFCSFWRFHFWCYASIKNWSNWCFEVQYTSSCYSWGAALLKQK